MRLLTKMASRFVAGETPEEALQVVKTLNGNQILTTLDILGENVTDKDGAIKLTNDYCNLITLLHQQLKPQNVIGNVSLKLTMLGLDISSDLAYSNLQKILTVAKECNNTFVRIDMEGSDYTSKTLNMFYKVRPDFNNVGIVLQAYLKRTMEDIKEVLKHQGSIRLCKGAYKEPEEIAYKSMIDIRDNFIKCCELLFNDSTYHAIATHDRKLIDRVLDKAKILNKSKKSFELQMLYGMKRRAWAKLVQEGYFFRVYVPFGTDWLPYFTRRLLERKENILCFGASPP